MPYTPICHACCIKARPLLLYDARAELLCCRCSAATRTAVCCCYAVLKALVVFPDQLQGVCGHHNGSLICAPAGTVPTVPTGGIGGQHHLDNKLHQGGSDELVPLVPAKIDCSTCCQLLSTRNGCISEKLQPQALSTTSRGPILPATRQRLLSTDMLRGPASLHACRMHPVAQRQC